MASSRPHARRCAPARRRARGVRRAADSARAGRSRCETPRRREARTVANGTRSASRSPIGSSQSRRTVASPIAQPGEVTTRPATTASAAAWARGRRRALDAAGSRAQRDRQEKRQERQDGRVPPACENHHWMLKVPAFRRKFMPAQCAICGKQRRVANNVSHSNIKTRSIQRPNLRRVHAKVGGTATRTSGSARAASARVSSPKPAKLGVADTRPSSGE